MAKIALITDTHWGARGDTQIFSRHQARFYHEVFFPYLDEHGIRIVRHLGDAVDRRKFINFLTVKSFKDQFVHPCQLRDIDLGFIIGNHDTFFKNTNEVNSMNSLFEGNMYTKMKWWDSPTVDVIDGTEILMMPWICSDNYEECMQAMQDTKAQVMFGHLEIAGFEMYKGSVTDHGFDGSIFKKFDQVFSGHFHHKSHRGNITYLGAPYEMTWSDYDDPRGFHIYDTDTRELEFIQNPFHLFHKVVYNDTKSSMSDIIAMDIDHLKDSYVKIIVQEKNNPYWFDMLIDKIEKLGVADLSVVEDHLNLDIEDADDIINEAEDTLTIIRKFAASYLAEKDPNMLKDLNTVLGTLYNEAMSMESDRS